VTVLQEEKASVLLENLRFQDRLSEFEGFEDFGTSTSHRYKELRKQLDAVKEEMFKVETCKILY
jgi:hypothetical protein